MGNKNLYQPTAEELDALWAKGYYKETPCSSTNCNTCKELRASRMAALLQIIARAQQHQSNKLTAICDVLWPGGNMDTVWSPDTIDEIARIVRPHE